MRIELRISGVSPAEPPPAREEWIEFQWAPLAKLRQARLEPAVLCRRLAGWLQARDGSRWAGF